MFRALLVLGLIACSSGALASSPCSPAPCDPKKPGGAALCAHKADWIIEGDIQAIAEEQGPMCATNMGCTILWRGGTISMPRESVALTKMSGDSALSGAFQLDTPYGFLIRIDSGSHCWFQTARLEPSMIGKRARFYGISSNNPLRLSSYVRVGYFAFEILE